VTIETGDRGIVVVLHPELVQSTWGETEDAAGRISAACAEVQRPQCLADLSELNFLSSAQVALLVRVWKGIRAGEGQFIIVAPNATVREILAVAGIDKLIQVYPTRTSAQSRLQIEVERPHEWWRWLLLVVAIAGNFVGAAGILLRPDAQLSITTLQGVQWIGAGIGFLAGVALLVIFHGWLRWVGAIAMAAAFAIALISMDPSRWRRSDSDATGIGPGGAATESYVASPGPSRTRPGQRTQFPPPAGILTDGAHRRFASVST